MSDLLATSAIGTRQVRLDGPDKVRGRATYAYEHPVDDPLYLCSAVVWAKIVEINALTGFECALPRR